MTHVYLDDETKFILNRIKNEDDKFNLSNFVQAAISNYVGLGTDDINKLYKKIADNRTKMEFLANENIFLENKINEINKKIEVSGKELEEEISRSKFLANAENFIREMNNHPEQVKEFKEGYPIKWKNRAEYYQFKLKEVKP
jgi:hypothetical protein